MDTICGIYMIKNIVNGKVYIGKSFDIKKRWSNHKYELNKGIHVNNHLQNAWNKYGENSFEFSIIEECNEDNLSNKEIYWIKETDAYHNGYNQTEGGEGTHLPEDVKAKIGAAAKEWWSDQENKNRMSESRKGEGSFWYGKTFPDDMIKKAISLGVAKINVNTECQLVFAEATRKYIEAGKDLEGKGFDPRKLLAPGFEAIKAKVKEKMELFGSVGKA